MPKTMTLQNELPSETAPKIYQLKVTLAGSRPPIWRRVLVPAHSTLAHLHAVIQALMGWHDYHLHDFATPGPGETDVKSRDARRVARRFVAIPDPSEEPVAMLMDGWDDDSGDEATAYLDAVVPAEKMSFLYTYDMGDNWEHDILVEKILPAEPNGIYPICVTGRRNGPLEDSGGIWGYDELLAILADPKHEEYRERKEWLREVFGVRTWDGEDFDLDDINKQLKRLQPKPKLAPRRRIPKASD
jgi:hypothetical protein